MNKQNYQLKILQLTDLHWSQDFLINKHSKKMITRIAMNFRPDLIVITGDLLLMFALKIQLLQLMI